MSRENPFDFFFKHGGWHYNPGAESPFAGHVRCATDMARAEFVAWDKGYHFIWSPDHIDSSDFSDEQPPYMLWCVLMLDDAGTVVGSLGCVDFGRDGEPWTDPYKRVVEAELAMEQLL